VLLDVDICGDSGPGSREPLSGSVRDLDVASTGWDTHQASWGYEATNPDEYELGLYVDGDLTRRLQSEVASAGLVGLLDGIHTLSLFPHLKGAPWPDRHGDPQGRRAYLAWTPPIDTTLAGYRVYWDEGAGGAPSTLIAELRRIVVEEAFAKRDQVNGNPGRVDCWGAYTGGTDPINDPIVVAVSSDGTYAWQTAVGLTGNGEFSSGQSIPLPHGAWIKFLDDPEAYGTLSYFGVWVGPEQSFLTPALEPGTHRFTIRSLDQAGNPAVPISSHTVFVQSIPPAAQISTSYNFATKQLAVSWSLPGEDDPWQEIRFYHNLNLVTGAFEPHVITDMFGASFPPEGGPWVFDFSGFSGSHQLRFYARTFRDGIERNDLSLYRFDFPVVPSQVGVILGTPSNLQLTPIAGGKLRFEWDYRDRSGDSVDHFQIFWGDATITDWTAPTETVSADLGSGTPLHFAVELDSASFADNTEIFAGVRASVADETLTSVNTDVVSARTDKTPPASPSGLLGVSQ
jgi:hypothetical protein